MTDIVDAMNLGGGTSAFFPRYTHSKTIQISIMQTWFQNLSTCKVSSHLISSNKNIIHSSHSLSSPLSSSWAIEGKQNERKLLDSTSGVWNDNKKIINYFHKFCIFTFDIFDFNDIHNMIRHIIISCISEILCFIDRCL